MNILKLDRLETHDRLLHLKKDQALNLSQGFDDCIKKNPLSLALQRYSKYIYIFAHPRTTDDGLNKRMLFQPRLGKPSAQTNSYLVRCETGTDIFEICWFLPPREQWSQYKQGNITQNDIVNWSVYQFIHHKKELQSPYQDDFSQEQIKAIYLKIGQEMDEEKRMKKIYSNENSTFEMI